MDFLKHLDEIVNKEFQAKDGVLCKPIVLNKSIYIYAVVLKSRIIASVRVTFKNNRASTIEFCNMKSKKACLIVDVSKKPMTKDEFVRRLKLFKASSYKFKLKESAEANIEKIMTYFQYAIVAFSLGLVVYSWYKNIKMKAIEAATTEKSFDEKLFSEHTGKEKEFVIYSELIKLITITATSKTINGMIVYGNPGTGKSYVVRRTLYLNKVKYKVFKGSTKSITELYQVLYNNNGKVIVFDDFDIDWSEEVVGFLKSVTDTQEKRIISFPTVSNNTSDSMEVSNAPDKFFFTGKLIILTNKSRKEIPEALLSRMPHIEVDFDPEKMIELIASMMKYISPQVPMKIKQEVLVFITEAYRKKKIRRLDIRVFELALSVRLASESEWKNILLKSIFS